MEATEESRRDKFTDQEGDNVEVGRVNLDEYPTLKEVPPPVEEEEPS